MSLSQSELEGDIFQKLNPTNTQNIVFKTPINQHQSQSWVNVVSFVKSWLPEKNVRLGEPNQKQKITELIMNELLWQMKIADQRKIEQENEERKQRTGVDYSWLVSIKPKTSALSDFKRLELEELCYQLDPDDCSGIIKSLWKINSNEKQLASDLPDLLQNILINRIQQKCQDNQLTTGAPSHFLGDFSKWLSGSVMSIFNQSDKTNTESLQELRSQNSFEMIEMELETV